MRRCDGRDPANAELATILSGSHELSEVFGEFTLRSNRGAIHLTRP